MIGTLTEGGQTWAHRIRMLRQVFKLASLCSMIIGAIVLASLLIMKPIIWYQSVWYYLKAESIGIVFDEISVNSNFWEKITNERYPSENFLAFSKHVSLYTKPYVDIFLNKIAEDLSIVGSISSVVFVGMLIFFFVKGSKDKRKKHISGRKKSPAFWVAFKLKVFRKASQFKIGKIPLVKGTETQHILVSGGTGSGKTNCFHHLVPQIREYGQKAVIIDTTGAFIDRYFREGKDVILNPFDDRSAPWHPWIECQDKFDYDAIAESFIPQSYSQSENYWRIAARTLFSAIIQKTANTRKTSELTQWILYTPLPKLCDFVKGTKAGAHLDMSSEKTTGSIRSVATSFLECLEHLQDTIQPFSIRQWIQNENDDGWLFLFCKPSQRTSLNPLLSCWFSIAARSLLHMKPDLNRRTWFIVDELPSLNRLKELESFVCESRKYGGCGLFALQSPAQLEAIYGQASARTIIGNCMTKIVFAEQDPQIAEMISKSFGECEIKEYQEGLSYGAHETRDGVNLSLQTKTLPLVSPTSIQSLCQNQAYIKLPGNIPIAKIKLPIASL